MILKEVCSLSDFYLYMVGWVDRFLADVVGYSLEYLAIVYHTCRLDTLYQLLRVYERKADVGDEGLEDGPGNRGISNTATQRTLFDCNFPTTHSCI